MLNGCSLIDMDVDHGIITWIADFLSERRQRVKYKEALSSWRTTQAGVPQGTKIGPVVFLAMINDFVVSKESDNILQYK